MLADVLAQALKPIAFAPARKRGVSVHGPAAEVLDAQLADRSVALEDQPDGVEVYMATGAALVLAMPRHQFPQGEVSQLHLVAGQLGDRGRRRRDEFPEQAANDPVTALHRAGSQARGVLGQENCHGQEAAAAVEVRVIGAHPVARAEIQFRHATFRHATFGHSTFGHSIVPGQGWIDESVVGVEKLEHGAILADEIYEEVDRLLEHRLAQLVGEAREELPIDAVVLLEAAEVEPVAGELSRQSAYARVA